MPQLQRRRSKAKNHRSIWRAFRPGLLHLEDRRLLATYIVDDPYAGGLGMYMPPGETQYGTITLESAIEQVNIDGGGSIGFSRAMTIDVAGDLSAITAPDVTINGGDLGSVIIDQGEYCCALYGLELDGGGALIENLAITGIGPTIGGVGIQIGSDSNVIESNIIEDNGIGISCSPLSGNNLSQNTIGGTASGEGNVISGNTGVGIDITDNDSDVVEGNFIGTDASTSEALPNGGGGLLLSGGSENSIGGTVASAANVLSGNQVYGVFIQDETQDVVAGNFIGTNAAGDKALPNLTAANMVSAGLALVGGSENTIGGSVAGAGNVISGNQDSGVFIFVETQDVVEGNFIGTNASGDNAVPNVTAANTVVFPAAGLELEGGSENTIGGTVAAAANVISGNQGDGIDLAENQDVVEGNFIGTDASGAEALANEEGLVSSGGENTIGGTIAAAANVISGNQGAGISLINDQDVVEGNFIGTDTCGSQAIPNGEGLELDGGSENTVGGTVAGSGNVISGNLGDGIFVSGGQNVLEGNLIGVSASGDVALPNGGDGVDLLGGGENTIGGTIAAAANIISGNGGDGIDVGTESIYFGFDTQDLIAGNCIGTDRSGSIALPNAGDGVSIYGGSQNTIGGTVIGAANVISGNQGYGIAIDSEEQDVVEGNFIGTDSSGAKALPNGTAASGDENYSGLYLDSGYDNTIGGTVVGAANIISGNQGYGIEIDSEEQDVVEGNFIGTDATGKAALGNGYSTDPEQPGLDGLYAVGGSDNTIGGTIAAARNVISGNAGYGVELADQSRDVIVGNLIGTDSAGGIALGNADGGIEAYDGSGNTFGGSAQGARNVISGNDQAGIYLLNEAQDLVTGNRLGTNTDGETALGNGLYGLYAYDGSSNTIGGTAAGAGNVISANGLAGVSLTGETQDLIAGNMIGTNAAGDQAIPNFGVGPLPGVGLFLSSGNDNTIGGTVAGATNVISGNKGSGIFISGETQDVVEGNFIGTNRKGTANIGNTDSGILVQDGSTENTIGGTVAGAGNTIAFNARNGVTVGAAIMDDSLENAILQNSIYSNNLLGISVTNSAPQSAPVLASAAVGSTQTTITGSITGPDDTTMRVELFRNPAGTGQGEVYLGSVSVTTNANGKASFTFTSATLAPVGQAITATATDSDGNTSEFSSTRERRRRSASKRDFASKDHSRRSGLQPCDPPVQPDRDDREHHQRGDHWPDRPGARGPFVERDGRQRDGQDSKHRSGGLALRSRAE